MIIFFPLDIDEPIAKAHKSAPAVDPSKVETLLSFGFDEEIARKALQASVMHLLCDFFFLMRIVGCQVACWSCNNQYLILYRMVILKKLLNGYLILLVRQIWILHLVIVEMWSMLLCLMVKEVGSSNSFKNLLCVLTAAAFQ